MCVCVYKTSIHIGLKIKNLLKIKKHFNRIEIPFIIIYILYKLLLKYTVVLYREESKTLNNSTFIINLLKILSFML